MPISASVFRRGGPKKELFDVINEDGDDENELNEKLAELDELLHTDKTGRELSAALWRPHLCAAELLKQRKQCARDVGFIRGRRLYLHIEEAVYLLDRGDLLLFIEELEQQQQPQPEGSGASSVAPGGPDGPPKLRQRLLSVQEAFDIMVAMGVSLERYLLYSSLCRSGYLVMRHPSRWLLERSEHPEQVWGDGAWAQCYGRQPAIPGRRPPQPLQQQLVLQQQQQQQQQQQAGPASMADAAAPSQGMTSAPTPALPADAAEASPDVADPGPAPMDVDGDAAAAPATAGQEDQSISNRGLGGGAERPAMPPQCQSLRQGTAAATAGAAAGGSRRWWLPAGPQHPHLAGIPDAFFAEMPPAPVEDRLGTSLLSRFPNLRPFPTISSAVSSAAQQAGLQAGPPRACTTGATLALAVTSASPTQAGGPLEAERHSGVGGSSGSTIGGSGADGGGVEAGGVSLGEPRASAHIVYDVYKPGSFVSRYKGQFPVVQTHVAMCSATPPALVEMRVADATAEAARAGEGGRPASVTWAATLNGDIALYSIGQADLLRLL